MPVSMIKDLPVVRLPVLIVEIKVTYKGLPISYNVKLLQRLKMKSNLIYVLLVVTMLVLINTAGSCRFNNSEGEFEMTTVVKVPPIDISRPENTALATFALG